MSRSMTPEEVARELDFMLEVSKWPLFPILPVKVLAEPALSKVGKDDHGIVLASDVQNDKPIVYVINIFKLKAGPLREQLEGLTTFEFDSVEAMVTEGWVGD